MTRFRHDDGTYTSSLTSARPSSVYSPHPYLAVGAESGVVSVFDLSRSASKEVGDRNDVSNPLKLKSVMNLTMKINAMAMHPAGELLAIGSDQVSFVFDSNELQFVSSVFSRLFCDYWYVSCYSAKTN